MCIRDSCKDDGSYEDVQCSEYTGECWCVNSLGVEQRATRSQEFVSCPGMGKCIRNYFSYSDRFTKLQWTFDSILYFLCAIWNRYWSNTMSTRIFARTLQTSLHSRGILRRYTVPRNSLLLRQWERRWDRTISNGASCEAKLHNSR